MAENRAEENRADQQQRRDDEGRADPEEANATAKDERRRDRHWWRDEREEPRASGYQGIENRRSAHVCYSCAPVRAASAA